jgi:DNA-binding Lrp family transcriptional regulator
MTIDALDARIIAELRAEPRAGLLETSRRLGVARGTVQARVAKLQARGVITGYGPEVDPAPLGYPILAFILLELAQGRLTEAVDALEEIPEVLDAHAISGPQDLICRIVARDTEHLQHLVTRILSTRSITRATSYIALTKQVDHRTGPLEREAASRAPRPARRRRRDRAA